MILDEPTANLDTVNRDWLIHQLKRYRGSLLVVSHDRYFLNQIVDRIWFLEHRSMTVFHGNYDGAMAQRKEKREAQTVAYEQYQAKKAQLQGVLDQKKVAAKKLTKKKKTVSTSDWKVNSRLGSYDGKAKSVAKSAKAMEQRINRLERVEKPRKENWVKLENKGHLDQNLQTLFRLQAGQVWREENVLFDFPEFSMKFGQKLGLLGRNGSGKTTFVEQLIHGQLAGYRSEKLAIAYFSQDLSHLKLEKTAYENAAESSEQDRVTILNLMAMLGLNYSLAQNKIEHLSGGERMRLGLAKVLLSDANLLVLDEPSNFLDIVTLEALEHFLQDYPGSVLLISHDEALMGKIAERLYVIKDGQLMEQALPLS